MSENLIRLALIGGRGHHTITTLLRQKEEVRLVALAADGRDDSVNMYQGQEYCAPDVPCFDGYEKMLDAVKPDLVSVGAQPSCNGKAVIAALERKIPVISDKPLANSEEELQRIRRLVQSNPNLPIVTEFSMRAQDTWLAARQAVREGAIGEVALVQGQKSYRFGASRPDFYKSREGYPGTVIFVGSHMIDLVYWVTGLKFAEVQGVQGNISRPDYGAFEDHAALLMKMTNGATTVIHMDYLRPAAAPTHADDRMRVAGTKEGSCGSPRWPRGPHDERPAAPRDLRGNT